MRISMNKKIFILLAASAVAFVMLLLISSLKSNNIEGNNDIETVYKENNEEFSIFNKVFIVTYEDQGLSNEVKKIMKDDLHNIYSHFQSSKLDSSDVYPKLVNIDGIEQTYDKKIKPIGKPRRWPKELTDVFGWVRVEDNKTYLLFSKELTDLYIKAFENIKNNQMAYRELSEFVGFMNDLTNKKVGSNYQDYMYVTYGADELNDEDQREFGEKFKSQFGRYKYSMPSILNFKKGLDYSNKTFKEFGGDLITEIGVQDENGQTISSMPLIYEKGKWKIIIFQYGT